MSLVELSEAQYTALFSRQGFVYHWPEFNKLNAAQVSALRYLVDDADRPRLGLILGVDAGGARTPFSAPFAGFCCLKPDLKVSDVWRAVAGLDAFVRNSACKQLRVVPPPLCYNESLQGKFAAAFVAHGFATTAVDLNYHFALADFDENYAQQIAHNARKNLRIALARDLQFRVAEQAAEQEIAYQVIRANRQAKGYPLRMTWELVRKTIDIVPAEFFLVQRSAEPIAAALVYHVLPDAAQVIYWGDSPGHTADKPINFLAYHLFRYFKERSFRLIDVGPSSEHGRPNGGLCDFKESIGCSMTPKFTFEKQYDR